MLTENEFFNTSLNIMKSQFYTLQAVAPAGKIQVSQHGISKTKNEVVLDEWDFETYFHPFYLGFEVMREEFPNCEIRFKPGAIPAK